MRLYYVTCAATLLVAGFSLIGCKKADKPKDIFDMGDRVKVGPLTYSVLETVWRDHLGEFPTQRVPERNFLLVRVTVTNSGGTDNSLPFLTVENSAGTSYMESQDGAGIPRWLGAFRKLPPAGTEEGWLLFDVPTNGYQLRVVGTDSEGIERAAMIKIPLTLAE